MNPIEHLWDVVERSIHTQKRAPTNTRDQGATIQMAWLNISPEVFGPLVESIPRQVAALRRAEQVLHDTRYLSHDFWHFRVEGRNNPA
jgi:hypothetical protein